MLLFVTLDWCHFGLGPNGIFKNPSHTCRSNLFRERNPMSVRQFCRAGSRGLKQTNTWDIRRRVFILFWNTLVTRWVASSTARTNVHEKHLPKPIDRLQPSFTNCALQNNFQCSAIRQDVFKIKIVFFFTGQTYLNIYNLLCFRRARTTYRV